MKPNQAVVEKIEAADLDRLGAELLALTDSEFIVRLRALITGDHPDYKHNRDLLTFWRGEADLAGPLAFRGLDVLNATRALVEDVFESPAGSVAQLIAVLAPYGFPYHLDARTKMLLDREPATNLVAAYDALVAAGVKVDPEWLPKNHPTSVPD